MSWCWNARMGEARVLPAEQEKATDTRPPSSLASDDTEVKVLTPFYRRTSCQICCGATTAVILAVLITILILTFTLFKTNDPVIQVTGMTLQSFSAKVDSTLTTLSLDVSLNLNVSVHNPNVASFKYESSSTFLYYRDREVGRAAIPAGKVGARKTERIETDLEIRGLQVVLTDANITSDLQAGIIPVSTHASIRGKLNVINVFKHHAVSTSDCYANIVVANASLADFKCFYFLSL